MKNKTISLIIFFLTICFCSCLKEHGRDKCMTDYYAIIEIKDKNYFNTKEIPGIALRDENLPFKQYVSNLSYHLHDLNSDKVVSKNPELMGESVQQSILLAFPGVSDGAYKLSLFGNTDHPSELRNERSVYQLHPSKQESSDIYIATADLDFFPEFSPKHVQLQRAKGHLTILMEGLPDSVGMIGMQIGPVYNETDQDLNYNAETEVEKTFTGLQYPSTRLFANIAPSPTGKSSVLRLALYKTAGDIEPFAYLPEIKVNMKRNTITALQIDYKPEGGVEIWIYTEGGWIKLHDLGLQ